MFLTSMSCLAQMIKACLWILLTWILLWYVDTIDVKTLVYWSDETQMNNSFIIKTSFCIINDYSAKWCLIERIKTSTRILKNYHLLCKMMLHNKSFIVCVSRVSSMIQNVSEYILYHTSYTNNNNNINNKWFIYGSRIPAPKAWPKKKPQKHFCPVP